MTHRYKEKHATVERAARPIPKTSGNYWGHSLNRLFAAPFRLMIERRVESKRDRVCSKVCVSKMECYRRAWLITMQTSTELYDSAGRHRNRRYKVLSNSREVLSTQRVCSLPNKKTQFYRTKHVYTRVPYQSYTQMLMFGCIYCYVQCYRSDTLWSRRPATSRHAITKTMIIDSLVIFITARSTSHT